MFLCTCILLYAYGYELIHAYGHVGGQAGICVLVLGV